MDLDLTRGDFLFSNTSSNIQNDLDYPCEKYIEVPPDKIQASRSQNASPKCQPTAATIWSSSSLSSMSSGLMSQDCRATKVPPINSPNISYELAVAKSIMQQCSTISGDNLFDHLSDIIKRVIDERPPNVIDFFEEFSRNVREQKFHQPERFPPDAVYEENRFYKVAKKQLISMNLPYPKDLTIQAEDELEEEEHSRHDDLKLEKKVLSTFHSFNDRVQHLQFFWNQCGFSISSEDIFQLACSMNRLQTHLSIIQCRFWGMINGLKASYYIVEATLSHKEYESRLLQMEKEIQENHMNLENTENPKPPTHIGPELTPGALGWENHPQEDLLKMKPQVLPVPLVKIVEVFDTPPEPIGQGVSRYSYFVVNSLSDEWIELPIVTPKQIVLSREIKKFFTGDLEADIVSYPCFCGKEKHYLRAIIARITAGTYIAPKNYYRKMTKKERQLFEGADEEEDKGEEEEEESQKDEEEENEEKEPDNDIVLLKNELYDSLIPLNSLNNPELWVHLRPNILQQGRIVWYNEEKAQREREEERKRQQRIRIQEEMGEELSENEDNDEEGSDEAEEEELDVHAEKGPAILSPCSSDTNSETPVPWVGRLTSKFTNQNERILIMKSNVWPGACTFVYKDLCESIYLGWGHKLVSRNMNWKHLKSIAEEYEHKPKDFIETLDPSVEMEEAYHLSLLKKDFMFINADDDEHGLQESSDNIDEDEDDNDDEEEEEEE